MRSVRRWRPPSNVGKKKNRTLDLRQLRFADTLNVRFWSKADMAPFGYPNRRECNNLGRFPTAAVATNAVTGNWL